MRALLLILPIALLAGCGGGKDDGGGVGCAAVYSVEAVPAFAGHYTAAYTPQGASAASRTYDLTVAADGKVTGTVRTGDNAAAVGGFSRAGNVLNECDTSQMAISVVSDEAIVAGESLSAARKRQGTIVGSYPANLVSEATQSSGTLVVSTAASAG